MLAGQNLFDQLLEMRGFGGQCMGTGLRYPHGFFVEVGRIEPHHPGERLAMGEAGILRHQAIAMPSGHFDEITEHGIMLDLERVDPGRFAVARFEYRD